MATQPDITIKFKAVTIPFSFWVLRVLIFIWRKLPFWIELKIRSGVKVWNYTHTNRKKQTTVYSIVFPYFY